MSAVADWRDRFKKTDPRRRLDTQPGSGDQFTQFGFRWGPFEVSRIGEFAVSNRKPHRVISLVTDAGRLLEVHVSGSGRSVRVFLDHVELKTPEGAK